jgi:hypothetical protein
MRNRFKPFSEAAPIASGIAIVASLIVYVAPGVVRADAAAGFEPPPTFDAVALLGAGKAKGAHYEVQSPVVSDGFLLTYRIRSDFGEWEVEGRPMLELRLREVGALAQLAELSKSEVFIDAVAEGVKGATVGQIETVQAFAERPVETLKGVPGGVSKLWKRTKAQADEAIDDYKASREEKKDQTTAEKASGAKDKTVDAGKAYAKKYLGVGSAERRWAQKLGVDPYSSNEILREQIAAVAKVDAAGRFGVRFIGIPGIPGLKYVRDLNKLVWETDPNELRLRNRKILAEAGVPDAVLADFFDNEWLSPTLQTAITQSISELTGVSDRARLVAQAAAVESEATAWFFTRGIRLLVESHETRSTLGAILEGRAAPIARAKSGAVVVALASEQVSWSEELAAGLGRIRSQFGDAKAFELLLAGELTRRARAELAASGVKVVEGLAGEFEAPVAPPANAK